MTANKQTPPDRLSSLRAELARRELAGFLIPRADEHQGEYVAPSAERLAWLTGFTGSAGLAAVLPECAAMFVDGRYVLQAEAEVDGAAFELRHLTDAPLDAWLSEHLAGRRLGYDPWLHTELQVERLKRVCAEAGGQAVACAGNPLDAVWADRPAPPLAPVVAHPLSFAGRPSADKRAEVAGLIKRQRAEAAVLSLPESIAWLLNVRGGDVPRTPLPLSFAILYIDGTVDWFVDPRKPDQALDAELGEAVRRFEPAAFGPRLDRLGERAVLVDPASAPAWVFDRLRAAKAEIVRGEDPCLLPKACKNEVELAGTREAHRRDGAALTTFLAWLAEAAPAGGVTEIAASEKLLALRRRDARFRDLSFDTISGSGANGAIVHYRVSERTDRVLQPGELYLVDSGAQYLDGTTDVTRTVAIGQPSEEMRDRFTRVLKGHIALATARFPVGTSGSQLDALARRALWQVGLDYDHGTGHGVGSYLGVHEGPQRISKAPNSVALKPGMIVSNEPGYYKTGGYGIRIENLVVVGETPRAAGEERAMLGFETLTLAPIDRALIARDLLSREEVAWLDAYHNRVHEMIGPLVDPATRAWLELATEPL